MENGHTPPAGPLPPAPDSALARPAPAPEASAAAPGSEAVAPETHEELSIRPADTGDPAGTPAAEGTVATPHPQGANLGAASDQSAPASALPPQRSVPGVAPAAEDHTARAHSERRPAVKRHHGLVRLTHWANALLLAGMMGSGLQIYSAFMHFGRRGGPFLPNPWDGRPLPQWTRLGGWLAGGLNWHFALAWPFVLSGLLYLLYLAVSGEWRSLLFRPRDVPRAVQMQLYYLRLRKEHPPQGKHNALQKAAYTFIVALGAVSVLSGFAIYKPVQLSWLTRLFGGYELARYWHFWAVFIFAAFILVHVALVFLVDPASLRAMITGWYRGRFPSHE